MCVIGKQNKKKGSCTIVVPGSNKRKNLFKQQSIE